MHRKEARIGIGVLVTLSLLACGLYNLPAVSSTASASPIEPTEQLSQPMDVNLDIYTCYEPDFINASCLDWDDIPLPNINAKIMLSEKESGQLGHNRSYAFKIYDKYYGLTEPDGKASFNFELKNPKTDVVSVELDQTTKVNINGEEKIVCLNDHAISNNFEEAKTVLLPESEMHYTYDKESCPIEDNIVTYK